MHYFRIYEGKFWCENEDVISEECTDYDRCNNECVCNNTEIDEVTVKIDDLYDYIDFCDAEMVYSQKLWLVRVRLMKAINKAKKENENA